MSEASYTRRTGRETICSTKTCQNVAPVGAVMCYGCSRASARRFTAKVLRLYGGKCQCCGMANPLYLSLDHRNGDGKEHRTRMNRHSICREALANYDPERFQILCHPCNNSKNTGETCLIDHALDPWDFMEK